MPTDEIPPRRSIAHDVKANVIAGLIVAAILAAAGLAYSLLRNLSLYEFLIFVLLPAALVGIIVSGAMILRALFELFVTVVGWKEKLEAQATATDARLTEAEDRIGRQIAHVAYGEVIAEAEAEGWKVERGERGALDFSHPEWGTASTGSDELDPDRLRLLLSMGRGLPPPAQD